MSEIVKYYVFKSVTGCYIRLDTYPNQNAGRYSQLLVWKINVKGIKLLSFDRRKLVMSSRIQKKAIHNDWGTWGDGTGSLLSIYKSGHSLCQSLVYPYSSLPHTAMSSGRLLPIHHLPIADKLAVTYKNMAYTYVLCM